MRNSGILKLKILKVYQVTSGTKEGFFFFSFFFHSHEGHNYGQTGHQEYLVCSDKRDSIRYGVAYSLGHSNEQTSEQQIYLKC